MNLYTGKSHILTFFHPEIKMSFHEELNQKLNVFFNRDWFVELSEQEEEKMEELAAGLVKDFGWDTVFHAAFK